MNDSIVKNDMIYTTSLAILNSDDLDNNEIHIKNNMTKEEDIISLDALIYYLDEKLNTGCEDEYCDCDDEDCHCGDDCECGGDCHCDHDHNHECNCK